MADSVPPSKADIQQVFKRMRSIPTNKQCFDCNSANPTWASVTYGVFLCIDCSATHRSLGVHLTFIRSTQLDTNWTWVQLRAMQCGGNANARAFFRQQGCTTNDAQQKYNSRAAHLYKEKLHQQALHAQRLYGTKVNIDVTAESTSPKEKEVDFFADHVTSVKNLGDSTPRSGSGANLAAMASSTPPRVDSGSKLNSMAQNGSSGNLTISTDDGGQPNVDAALVSPKAVTEPRKSTIGVRKPAPKKGLGKGMGATRVKANFSDIESQALRADQEKEQQIKNMAVQQEQDAEDEAKRMANMRLAYNDMAKEKKKHEDKMRNLDPKKAEQAERLGMGYASSSRGISHSAMSDMTVIEQEKPASSKTDRFQTSSNRDFDDWERVGNSSLPVESVTISPPADRYDDLGRRKDSRTGGSSWGQSSWDKGGGASGWDRPGTESSWDSDRFDKKTTNNFFDETLMTSKPKDDSERAGRSRRAGNTAVASQDAGDFSKKYANAKSISSSQVFGDDKSDPVVDSSKFQGSASISSDDYFGRPTAKPSSYNTPDIQEIKDGVKQGVTKVAGKLSNLASGVMSSLQKTKASL